MIIRNYDTSDKNELLSIDDEWSSGIKVIITSYIPNENEVESCLVAEDNGKIVGFIYGYILPHKTLIPHFMYVIKSYRGKGVSTELLNQFELRSNCEVSQIYYNKTLSSHYKKQGYVSSNDLEVAIKDLSIEKVKLFRFEDTSAVE